MSQEKINYVKLFSTWQNVISWLHTINYTHGVNATNFGKLTKSKIIDPLDELTSIITGNKLLILTAILN